ncbi:amidohydrolase family protein [Crenobacter sp. SG2303]|uniref:Amidohydrolase family protein n=1 Tax=Crenobacter oryzisoli TaxID=3056844 RepID=A0ABT7XIZ4_9NEIS|nr:amidohydrolase family protein [Crenobacter sp. SG2303]MDN0073750.1 amidohydrolase family protein [Crenobacter sp. SG2303]
MTIRNDQNTATMHVDLLIEHGIVITVDETRRVIEDGAVAVRGDRIVAVGCTDDLRARYTADKIINARHKAVLPGLIDSHAHAGHAMLKTLGGGDGDAWMEACQTIYTSASGPEFWEVDARLSALERLKCGTTTGVSMLGGGDSIMRVDDPIYAQRHALAVAETGTRSVVAVGPSRLPAPLAYVDWSTEPPRRREVDAAAMFEVCEEIVRTCDGQGDGRVRIAITLPVYAPQYEQSHQALAAEFRQQAQDYMGLARRHGLTFTQDGHRGGTLTLAHRELGLLGPTSFMSHSIDLTEEDIALCRETQTKIVHNPSAIMSILGRCPVPELIEAGVTVAIGSDGAAPDRGYDLFRHMFQCMHYHRRHFRDPDILPHGKVLEMITIDAAKALSLDHEIGSLEVGKKADIILVDLFKPHLMPMNMPVYRVTCFANGGDVCTTIVDGKILMENYVVRTVDEHAVLEAVQEESERMLERSGLRHLTAESANLWRAARY